MILNRNGFTKSNRERNCQDKPGPQAGKAIARDTAQGYMDSSLVYDCPRMKSRKNPAPGRKKARRSEIAWPQTVDNPSPMRRCSDSHGEIVKRGRESPLHVQSMQKWELFRKFPFLRLKLSTLCRQLEPGLRKSRRPGKAFSKFNSQNGKLFIPGSCRCRGRRLPAGPGRSGRR